MSTSENVPSRVRAAIAEKARLFPDAVCARAEQGRPVTWAQMFEHVCAEDELGLAFVDDLLGAAASLLGARATREGP